MSGRRVNFRDSPPSSGVSSHYTNDSASSRYSSGGGGDSSTNGGGSTAGVSQWTDLPALQEMYRRVLVELDEWKTLAEDREDEVEEAKKQASEAEAKWRDMVERNEQIEDEKKKLFKENKDLKSQIKAIDELQDTIHELREELATSNRHINEMQLNVAPAAYGTPGNSPPRHHQSSSSNHHGHGDTKSSPSSSRHSKDGKASSLSAKSSSNAGSGTSSSSSASHSSSRAKVGSNSSSSSTNTAKLSRSGSRHEHHHEKDQKSRLSSRFDHKDDAIIDSNASASSATSSSSQKHHKSGSSGNGSSGSNGSSTSADSGSMRPPPPRARRGSYVEGHGPGAPIMSQMAQLQTAMSPNKGVVRSSASQPSNMLPPAGAVPGGVPSSYYGGGRGGYAQPVQYGMPPSSTGLISPRGDMGKDSLRTTVHIVTDADLDPTYYAASYASPRDPRDPRIPRR
ncbi:hypothetical protein SCUCBS95973_005665 [Sporothrix curviconia]|uniref:Uncharacterized protein n=1 Tax=Sporothrix curviconia TaxID=1260050 RepID=A0ABP0BZ53_9PEZI